MVGLRVGQIDFLVRTVEIAAAYDGLQFVQIHQVGLKGAVPVAFLVQVHQFCSGVSHVDVHLEKRPNWLANQMNPDNPAVCPVGPPPTR